MIRGVADLGSNTIRLSIYQCDGAGNRLLMNRKVMAGLAGYVEKGALTPQGIQVACQVLEEFHAQGLFIDEKDRITVTGGLDFTLTGEGYTLSPLPD